MSNEPLVETIHDQFNALDADVTFKSSDRVLFRLHKRNMAITSGGFPGPEMDATGQIVCLAEPSAVLEVIFQFLYPERHPKLADEIKFSLLVQIAETAQKYDVYAATDACENKFYEILPGHSHGIEIMAYAIRHNNHKLTDASALRLCCYPMGRVIQGIPPEYALHWVRYREECRNLLFSEAEADALTPIEDLRYEDTTQDELLCSMDILYWIHRLKKEAYIDGINDAALDEFAKKHMDKMPHHTDYEDLFTEGICPLAKFALRSVQNGRKEVEKESFSSYYLTNKT